MNLALTLLLTSIGADAGTHPICAVDLSTVQLSVGQALFLPPQQLEERALRPGLLYVQSEVCRCLPRRKRHQPDVVRAWLRIALGKGELTVEYGLEAAEEHHRSAQRMVACLGEPTLHMVPLQYRSDIRTAEGSGGEIMVYPLKLVLTQ